MGCDIHVYIEYRKKGKTGQWSDFGARINPGRNYFMFGILAGVRSDPEFSFQPRGMPDDYSGNVHEDYLIYISEDGKEEGYATLEKAKMWEQYGSKIIEQDGKPTWVEAPDWHTHSWLTTQEYKRALEYFNNASKEWQYMEPKYEAILSAMLRFEEIGYDARIVFWFDN